MTNELKLELLAALRAYKELWRPNTNDWDAGWADSNSTLVREEADRLIEAVSNLEVDK